MVEVEQLVGEEPFKGMLIPRQYQIEGADFMAAIARGRALCRDEMGLGKTGQTYLTLNRLKPARTLIVCGKNAQHVWQKEAPLWGHETPTIVRGKPEERQIMWKEANSLRKGVWTCTREVLKRDLKSGWCPRQWDCIIVDECHKDTNRKTQNFAALASLGSPYMLLLSGNQVTVPKLWALLHLLYPKRFSSYWRFIRTFCESEQDWMGHWQITGPKNLDGLHKQLAAIMIARTKKQVRPQMPPKIRSFLQVDMEPDQEKVYKDLEDKMLAELPSKGILAVSDVLTRLIRLRQCLITPKLLDPKLSWGAGFEQIGDLMDDTDDHHFAVFTPFRAPLPILKDYLVSRGTQPDNIILLHGGLSVEELGIRLAHFREERGVALVTIKFAESFDLIPACWGVFLGVEWTPDENWQAEDRLHRGNIERAVNIYYIQHKGTIDTTLMLPTLDEKASLARRTTLNADLLRQAIQQRRLYNGV